MGLLRAEFTSYFTDDIPRDMDVNTVYFRDDSGDGLLEALQLVPHVGVDWHATALAWAGSLHDYFNGNSLFGSGRGVKCKLYDMGATKPRPELGFGDVGGTASRVSSSAGNPKVAAVLSFYGTRNLPRQRGRLYLGPLSETNAGAQTLGSTQRTAVLGLAGILGGLQLQVPDPGTNTDVTWVVYSPTSNSAWKVTNAWCDDELDTQRRRGERATARTTVAVTP